MQQLEYVVAYEPAVDGFTVRVPTDVSENRFIAIASFRSFEEAHWLITEIRKLGGLKAWENHIKSNI